MIPSLIHALNDNKKYMNSVNIFEIGRTFAYNLNGKEKECIEKKHLAILIADKNKTEKEMFYDMKKIIENVCNISKNATPKLMQATIEENFAHPTNAAKIYLKEKEIGYMSVLHPIIRNEIDKKLNVIVAEIYLEELDAIEKEIKIPKKVSKFQEVIIDLSLIVSKDVKYEEIEREISNIGIEELVSYRLVDIYESELLKDKRSLTIGLTLGSNERTLTSEEINNIIEMLISSFEKRGIEIRR